MSNPRVFGTCDPFVETGEVLGRRVANHGFLAALFRADPFDEYHFFLADEARREGLAATLGSLFPSRTGKIQVLDRRRLPEYLAETPYHCFHQSDCLDNLVDLARLRTLHSPRLFPVTGPIHSLSYARYGRAFLPHLWPGATVRECIVATSTGGELAVGEYFKWLREGYGLADMPGPSVRRIPLGVDPDELAPADAKTRAAARMDLGLDPHRVWFLVFGRIAHNSKMDLLPLLRAFQRLFLDGADPASVGLVLAGWVEDGDRFPDTLGELAANVGLNLKVFSRPDEVRKTLLYQAADAFVSVSDNPQETFGITVIEAGAAGLPAVVSEYDGYRDLVAHDKTGLLVPTLGAPDSTRLDALAPVLFDNQYHLYLTQQTVVDVPALADALGRLMEDPDLCSAFGAAARERVLERFTWDRVVRMHLDLWEELWGLPAERSDMPHPTHVPFSRIFGHYPSRLLGDDLTVAWSRSGQAVYRGQEFPLVYPGVEDRIRLDEIKKLLYAARKPVPAGELTARFMDMAGIKDLEKARFCLLWALKQDLLEPA